MRVQSSKFKSSKLGLLAAWVACVGLAARGAGAQEGGPELAEPVSSFGAAVEGDALYVYSGHIGEAHEHTAENLSQGFRRLKLNGRGAQWEELPMGTPLQGLAVVSYKGNVYRVGGLSARNEFNEVEDLHSVDEFARFDTAKSEWVSLPALPEARSSHDAAVFGDKLYVVGGWNLTGKSKDAVWAEHGYVTRLGVDDPRWVPLPPQPFKHRALALAATTNRIYVIGGLNAEGKTTNEVYAFDPAAMEWSRGPDIPATSELKAFGVSAFGVGDTVWASAADGKVFALQEGADHWTDTGYTLKQPRFFHRLLHHSGRLLFLGGASPAGHLATIESVDLALLEATPSESLTTSPVAPKGGAGSTSWPGFRGYGAGNTEARDLPLSWSDTDNFCWRIDLPGYGQSSPVALGGKLFVTSVSGEQQEALHVTCLDADKGTTIWTRTFEASQQWPNDDYHARAASTPVVDDTALYAFFQSGDLIALDHDGKTLWQRSLTKEYGPFEGNHGVASSVELGDEDNGVVYALVDHKGPSYLLCIDKKTGQNRWKADRTPRSAWSTPVESYDTVIVSSGGSVDAYNAFSGELRWTHDGVHGNTVTSPTLAGNFVFVGGEGDGSNMMMELQTGNVLWTAQGSLSHFASPIDVGDGVYFVSKAGVATCVDFLTGAKRWSLRLPGPCWASPIAAGELIYFFCKDGQTVVLRADASEPVKVAESTIDLGDGERVYGVAAIDGAFFIRTGTELIRVGKP